MHEQFVQPGHVLGGLTEFARADDLVAARALVAKSVGGRGQAAVFADHSGGIILVDQKGEKIRPVSFVRVGL